MMFTIEGSFGSTHPLSVLPEGSIIRLVTPAEFSGIPDGTELYCIDGRKVIKGTDYIDDDTRLGCMAFGYLSSTPNERG